MLQVSGYKMFQDRIPNGNAVPHPCKPNYVFHGVGHKNPKGGGERNPFGLAFYNAGKVCYFKWSGVIAFHAPVKILSLIQCIRGGKFWNGRGNRVFKNICFS